MKHQRSFIGQIGAIAAVILVALAAFIIDSWVIGSIEGSFSKDPFLHALSTGGIFIGGFALALLMTMKLFDTPNEEQEEILSYGFAAEIICLLINAGLAISPSIGISGGMLPWARLVLIGANILVGASVVVMYFKKDSHSELGRLEHDNKVKSSKAELNTQLALTEAKATARQHQARFYSDLYQKAMSAPEIYNIMEFAAKSTAVQYASEITGLHLGQHFNLKPPQLPQGQPAARSTDEMLDTQQNLLDKVVERLAAQMAANAESAKTNGGAYHADATAPDMPPKP